MLWGNKLLQLELDVTAAESDWKQLDAVDADLMSATKGFMAGYKKLARIKYFNIEFLVTGIRRN